MAAGKLRLNFIEEFFGNDWGEVAEDGVANRTAFTVTLRMRLKLAHCAPIPLQEQPLPRQLATPVKIATLLAPRFLKSIGLVGALSVPLGQGSVEGLQVLWFLPKCRKVVDQPKHL